MDVLAAKITYKSKITLAAKPDGDNLSELLTFGQKIGQGIAKMRGSLYIE